MYIYIDRAIPLWRREEQRKEGKEETLEKGRKRERERENWHKEGKINRINAYPSVSTRRHLLTDARNFVHAGDTQVAEHAHTQAWDKGIIRRYATRTQDYRVELRVRSRYLRIP